MLPAPPYVPPFQAHANLMAQYEGFIAGGNPAGLATLTFTNGTDTLKIPVTHTEIKETFLQIPGGQSSMTLVERCEFRAALVASFVIAGVQFRKGLNCILQVTPTGPKLLMQLWQGGLQEGGTMYRFELASQYFGA